MTVTTEPGALVEATVSEGSPTATAVADGSGVTVLGVPLNPNAANILARLEAQLIERYHAGLLAHGVTGYGLDSLWEDYRLSVIGHLAIPVWQQSYGLHASIWWPHLHRILAAFEDLGCAALLS